MDLLPTSSEDSASSLDTGSVDIPYPSEPTPETDLQMDLNKVSSFVSRATPPHTHTHTQRQVDAPAHVLEKTVDHQSPYIIRPTYNIYVQGLPPALAPLLATVSSSNVPTEPFAATPPIPLPFGQKRVIRKKKNHATASDPFRLNIIDPKRGPSPVSVATCLPVTVPAVPANPFSVATKRSPDFENGFSPNPPAKLPSLPVVASHDPIAADVSLLQHPTNPSTRPQPVSTYPHVVTEEEHTQMLLFNEQYNRIVFNIDLEGNSLDGGEPTKPRASQQLTNRNYEDALAVCTARALNDKEVLSTLRDRLQAKYYDILNHVSMKVGRTPSGVEVTQLLRGGKLIVRQKDVCAYENVFGMELHEPVECEPRLLRECVTVRDRLNLLPNPEFEASLEQFYLIDGEPEHQTSIDTYWEEGSYNWESDKENAECDSYINAFPGDSENHKEDNPLFPDNEHRHQEDINVAEKEDDLQDEDVNGQTSDGDTSDTSDTSDEDDNSLDKVRDFDYPQFNKDGLVYPILKCRKRLCTFHSREVSLSIGNNEHQQQHLLQPTVWWGSAFIASFAAMLAHDVHHPGLLYVHCPYPGSEITEEEIHPLGSGRTVLSVLHGKDHYVVLEMDVQERTVWICDGRKYNLMTWTKHITNILKRTGMMGLDVSPSYGSKSDYCSQLFLKVNGVVEWSIKSSELVMQVDAYNCGPVACLKLWSMFAPGDVDVTRLCVGEYRAVVVSKFNELFEKMKAKMKWNKRRVVKEGELVQLALEESAPSAYGKHNEECNSSYPSTMKHQDTSLPEGGSVVPLALDESAPSAYGKHNEECTSSYASTTKHQDISLPEGGSSEATVSMMWYRMTRQRWGTRISRGVKKGKEEEKGNDPEQRKCSNRKVKD